MELYRVRYVRVCERKVETVDLATLRYLENASHMGIRVTSYKKATDRQVELYLKAHPQALEAEPTTDSPVKVYLVVCDTTKGLMDVELIGTTSERAANRARWTLIHSRIYGDIDQVQWISVEEVICQYYAACANTATRLVEVLKTSIPTCQRCYDKAESLKPTR